ncbi:protein of unknown function [Spirosomataceae bacterium TFI 002]|nr:protein of unknown function [Spirosomataceae bacterium TFI 002]
MNLLKSISILLLFASSALYAQEERLTLTPQERADRATKQMTEKLSLNEDQVFAITFVNNDFYASSKDRPNFREMSTEDREAFREEMKGKNEIYQASIQAILTKEQFEKWSQLQGEGRGSQSGERSRRGQRGN